MVTATPKAVAVIAVRMYQGSLSNFLGGNCRYYPTCSEYCRECFDHMPFYKALAFSIRRVLSCRPFGGYGFDPIPTKQGNK